MVGDNPIGRAPLDHEVRDVRLRPVHESGGHAAAPVQFPDRVQAVLVQESLDQNAVDLLPDAPVHAVDDVFDHCPARQMDLQEIAEGVVRVGSRGAAAALGRKLAAGTIGPRRSAGLQQPILAVISRGDTVPARPVAVGIIDVGGDCRPVRVYSGTSKRDSRSHAPGGLSRRATKARPRTRHEALFGFHDHHRAAAALSNTQ